MSTKERVLALLERSRGTYLSGQEMADGLGLSRAAVWKAVKALEREGHPIRAVSNRGYALSEEGRVLSAQGLMPYLARADYAALLHVYDCLPSTNDTAKQMAQTGCPHGTVVIANRQSNGRGRQGRGFYSPPESGLYLSVVLHAGEIRLSDPVMITQAAAVAVCRAIETVTGHSPAIKWVNDILLEGKKVCGILTEAITDLESGGMDWVVVGAGVNIDTRDFPQELEGKAASLFPQGASGAVRGRLAAQLVNLFLEPGAWQNEAEILEQYNRKLTKK